MRNVSLVLRGAEEEAEELRVSGEEEAKLVVREEDHERAVGAGSGRDGGEILEMGASQMKRRRVTVDGGAENGDDHGDLSNAEGAAPVQSGPPVKKFFV